MSKLNLDKLDYQIIQSMMENAEVSYADLGKRLFVSGGTIHVRMKKLQELGVVKGTRLNVDTHLLGYNVIAFIGIFLEKSSLYNQVAEDLKDIHQVTRVNYTTGNYTIFIKVLCKDNDHLMQILSKLQKFKGVTRTETFISLEQSIARQLKV